MRLAIVTGNPGKMEELKAALGPIGFEVVQSDEDCDEVQADSLEEVVQGCMRQLKERGIHDFALDDSGLFIESLKGFPGVYSAYVLRTLGIAGVLKQMDGMKDRSAHFRSCIGCHLDDGDDIIVVGQCDGDIAYAPKGECGFGFDPIFIPKGYDRTFAEISIDEKNSISHRGKAIKALVSELDRRLG